MVLLETRGEFWDRLRAASEGASAADFTALAPEDFVQQALAPYKLHATRSGSVGCARILLVQSTNIHLMPHGSRCSCS